MKQKKIFKKTEKIFPGFAGNIKVNTIAAPTTFYRYTQNKNGAAFDWASKINQEKASFFSPKKSLDILFLVRHR